MQWGNLRRAAPSRKPSGRRTVTMAGIFMAMGSEQLAIKNLRGGEGEAGGGEEEY